MKLVVFYIKSTESSNSAANLRLGVASDFPIKCGGTLNAVFVNIDFMPLDNYFIIYSFLIIWKKIIKKYFYSLNFFHIK